MLLNFTHYQFIGMYSRTSLPFAHIIIGCITALSDRLLNQEATANGKRQTAKNGGIHV
ncbi:protein of unknown function [Vibrio tapetis subsp. tapetis]|uniref:Uncharacterized protein n=1 Tax=Vibrio tapetis subsp. tapetis TaxID=1671868 RepID=A0A2N8Z9A2_9VIBR|nr:protein of unknown function [Vibrio tapetis subsp. tapetis]